MSTQYLSGTQMIQRRFIEGRVRELTEGFFVTDQLFMLDQSNAQAITYQENGAIGGDSPDTEVRERGELGEYPRISTTDAEKQAAIKDYGLEAPISDKAVRFNKLASIDRSFRRIGNALVRFVDYKGLKALTDGYNQASTRINTLTLATPWDNAGAKPLFDLVQAIKKCRDAGYEPDSWVLNTYDMAQLLGNDTFRKELDTDVPADLKAVRTRTFRGRVLGLNIFESMNLAADYSVVCQGKVLGNRSQTSADVESYTYREDRQKATIVQVYREVVHYLTDPLSVCLVYNTKT